RRVFVVGRMSGTSVDGIDAAVVDITEQADALAIKLLGYAESSIDERLRQRIHTLFNPERSRVDEVCEINVLLGEAFAGAASLALRRADVRADLIASHGQTVWHEVSPGHTRSTLQLGEASVIAERLGVTTVADFRPRDIAAGGQGAPLASWGDALLFGHDTLCRAVQNIGGIGNVTWVPPGGQWQAMLAFDTGPGNALIDHATWRLTGGMQRYDADGAMAASGRVDDGLLSELLDPEQIRLHEDFGLPSLGREAIYFALMGHEALHGRANTIPSCTGGSHPVVMGKLVPGANYRSLMARVAAASDARPRRLIVL